jgi:predicted amidophosphoribosyltransferase
LLNFGKFSVSRTDKRLDRVKDLWGKFTTCLDNFCGQMGIEKPDYIFCAQCGKRMKKGAQFCTECGKSLYKEGI